MSIGTDLRALGATHMTADSRKVGASTVFVAYPGEKSDGRDFISQAVERGAIAVVWEGREYTWTMQGSLPNFSVENLKQHVGEIAADFYGRPSQKLWMVGVTGTNGKTSCSQWIASALSNLGSKTAVIGTLGNGFPGALLPAKNTTPDAIELQAMLADFSAQGAQSVAMEVSSHGLDQGRVNGVKFDVAVFTNLTHDHLDYHGTMQQYAAAKRKLITWPSLRFAVINADDEYGKEWIKEVEPESASILAYSLGLAEGVEADIVAENLQLSSSGISMQVRTSKDTANLHAPLYGKFNASNLLAVIGAMLASGFSLEKVAKTVSELRSVNGRMQSFGGGNLPVVIVDYAHTPDALSSVLTTLREQVVGKLICVFGCGGNRDVSKRSVMGEIAGRLADTVIITNDNPRDEEPQAIAQEIVKGVISRGMANYEVELDRAKAIFSAVSGADVRDIVLVAGKGHEDYQEIKGERLPFLDADLVAKALARYEVAA